MVEEVAALLALWPVAEEVQWDRSLARRGSRDESGRRASGGHSNPTEDVATDPSRLYVRTVVARCEEAVEVSLVHLRGVRRAMERALDGWDRPDDLGPAD